MTTTQGKPARFDKAVDGETGEPLLVVNQTPNFKITSNNGTAIIDTNEATRKMEELAARQRVREEERFLARLEAEKKQVDEVEQWKKRVADLEMQLKPKSEEKSLNEAAEKQSSQVEKSTKEEKLNSASMGSSSPPMTELDYAKFAELYARKQQEEKEAAERDAKLKQEDEEKKKYMAEIARAEFARLQQEAAAAAAAKQTQTEAPQGTKRKAEEKRAEKLDEEDDAFSDDDEVDDLANESLKRTKQFDSDIEDIKKHFGEFAAEAKKLKDSKDRFLLNPNKGGTEVAAKREASFKAREERLETKKNALLDWASNKLMQYAKDTNGAVPFNFETMITDLKARSGVDIEKTQRLQATVEAAASTKREFDKKQQTLTDLEKKLEETRRLHAEKEMQLKRVQMGLSAEYEASRIDPLAHKKAISGAAAAMSASSQASGGDNARWKKSLFTAYSTSNQFVATASSQSKGSDGVDYADSENKLPMWRQKRANLNEIPRFHEKHGRLGYGPEGSGAALHPPRPLEEGMAYSEDPRHQAVFQRMVAYRDSMSTKGAKLPILMPGDYAEEENTRGAVSSSDFLANSMRF